MNHCTGSLNSSSKILICLGFSSYEKSTIVGTRWLKGPNIALVALTPLFVFKNVLPQKIPLEILVCERVVNFLKLFLLDLGLFQNTISKVVSMDLHSVCS